MAEEQKKDKKDKKKKEKKEKKKEEKDQLALEDKFKPVANPAYNPLSASDEETWTVSSNRSSQAISVHSQNPTPAELQGFAAEKFVPSSGYTHLDPSQHKNAHSAFERLQKVVRETQEQNPVKPSMPQPLPKLTPTQPGRQPMDTRQPARPVLYPSSSQQSPSQNGPSSSQNRPSPSQPLAHPGQPRMGQPQPQPPSGQSYRPSPSDSSKHQLPSDAYRPPPISHSPSRPPQPQLPPHQIRPQQPSYPHRQRPIHSQPLPRQQQQRAPSLPQRLEDGMVVMHHARAIWSYNAKIASELTFVANEYFGVINKQPDGWWYVELLNPQQRRRGLVPGNYMASV